MMQADLLKFARQGNSQAIAQLMNAALAPRGIDVQTTLEAGCLYVYLISDQRLQADVLVNFTRSGLLKLAIPTLHTVRLHAHKVGQRQPLWVETFSLTASEVPAKAAVAVGTASAGFGSTGSSGGTTERATFTASAKVAPTAVPSPVILRSPQMSPPRSMGLAQRGRRWLRQLQRRWQQTIGASYPSQRRRYKGRLSPAYRTAGMLAGAAFVVGGTIALFGHLNQSTQASDATSQNPAALAASEQELIKQQADAKSYLLKMNQAQANFYHEHGKFAPNLEELERSASILFPSYGYTFKLVAEDGKISRLLAYPKSDGLKGMIAVVVVPSDSSGQASHTAHTQICETQQTAKEPPSDPQVVGDAIQCPAGAAIVQ